MLDWLIQTVERIFYILPGVLLGFSAHEFAHAIVAVKLGDPTPQEQGRITLMPLNHLSLMGTLCIFFFGFGWAKPVQINPNNFKNPRRDSFLVTLAGPIANLIVALLFVALFKYSTANFGVIMGFLGFEATMLLRNLLAYSVYINIVLMIFNLFPIPPLDGFKLLSNFVPRKYFKFVFFLERYGSFVLLFLVFTNTTAYLISGPAIFIMHLLGI